MEDAPYVATGLETHKLGQGQDQDQATLRAPKAILGRDKMQQTTQSILLAALKQDGGFTPSQIAEAMAILTGKPRVAEET